MPKKRTRGIKDAISAKSVKTESAKTIKAETVKKSNKESKSIKSVKAEQKKTESKKDDKKKKPKTADLDVIVKLMPSEADSDCKTEKPEPQDDIQGMLYSAMHSKLDMPDEIVFILPNNKKNLEVKLSDECKVVEISEKSPLSKHLLVNDKIIRIDDTEITKCEKARNLLKKPDTKKDIIIIRVIRAPDTERDYDDIRLALMQQRVHLIRHGFKYFVLELNWKADCKMSMGLMVCHVKGRVLVRRFTKHSIAASIFKEHDRIMDINGAPVFDRHETKELLLATLHRTGWASILMERAHLPNAQRFMAALTARGDYLLRAGDEPPPPQITQPKDVSTIVNKHLGTKKKQKEAGKGKLVQQPKPILKQSPIDPERSLVVTMDFSSPTVGSQIKWPQEDTKLQKVYEVASDIQQNKTLRPVPKPQAPYTTSCTNTQSATVSAPIVSVTDVSNSSKIAK